MKLQKKIRFYILLVILFGLILNSACKKKNGLPIVTTSAISAITQTDATCGGVITSDGGTPITVRGICWNTETNPTTTNSIKLGKEGDDMFILTISGLTAGITYHVRAFASNSVGTTYGDDITFSTKKNLATITTTNVTSITTTTANSGGTVVAIGGDSVISRGVCWGQYTNPTINNSKTIDGEGIGNFVSNITGLIPNMTYHLRAYATNSGGTAYGRAIEFLTLIDPLVNYDHMLLGNASGATNDTSNASNYLMYKSQYCLSYNNTKHTPNWTSWHLCANDLGSVDRQNDFREDFTLPSSWYKVVASEFSGSGFDRGHMCPSADRTSTITNNSATFLMTNMIPQAPLNNQQTWANLENYSRTLVYDGNELYIICGPYGQGGSGSYGYALTVGNGVVVPNKTWKIIVVLPFGDNDLSRISSTTRVITVLMPNDQNCSVYTWEHYKISVDSLETLTGYDFLSNVPSNVQNIIESTVDNL